MRLIERCGACGSEFTIQALYGAVEAAERWRMGHACAGFEADGPGSAQIERIEDAIEPELHIGFRA